MYIFRFREFCRIMIMINLWDRKVLNTLDILFVVVLSKYCWLLSVMIPHFLVCLTLLVEPKPARSAEGKGSD